MSADAPTSLNVLRHRQVVADLWLVDATLLERVEPLWSVLLGAVRDSGATVLAECVHQFEPAGFTGVVLLAQSHVSIHTWTDQRLLLLDIQTCGPIDADLILQRLAAYLRPLRVERREWERGVAEASRAAPYVKGSVAVLFRDRAEAGQRLAQRLLAAVPDLPKQQPLVLALPRGGVPVGFEVAQALPAPLDILVVRKLGAPEQEELGIGAVAPGGTRVLDADTIRALAVSQTYLDAVTARELAELERRTQAYRDDRPPPLIAGRPVVLVDDGLATGVSARAALAAVQREAPARLLLAVPVCPEETRATFEREGYEVVCVATPSPFHAVGVWYDDFHPVSDDEVVGLLHRAWGELGTLL